jgi:hypothetical protein
LLGAAAVGENTHVCVHPVLVEFEGVGGPVTVSGQCRDLLRCGRSVNSKAKNDSKGYPVYSTSVALLHLQKKHPDNPAVKQQLERSHISKKQKQETQRTYSAEVLSGQVHHTDHSQGASGATSGGSHVQLAGHVPTVLERFVKKLSPQAKAEVAQSEL